MSFLSSVSLNVEILSKNQLRLAEYIIHNRREVVFMSAKALGAKVNQSDTSVIRFAQDIGFTGYAALKRTLRSELLSKVGASGMYGSGRMSNHRAMSDDAFAVDVSTINETSTLNSYETMHGAAEIMCRARRIFTVAHGTSYPLAAYAAGLLNEMLDNATVVTIGHGHLAELFRCVGGEDAFLSIGYARHLPYTVEMTRHAHEHGASVVAVTDAVVSPLVPYADQVIYIARSPSPSQWWTQAGTLSVINYLTRLIMTESRERVRENLKRIDGEWVALGHWDPSNEDGVSERMRMMEGKP